MRDELIAFAAHEFELDAPREGGSLRDHYISAARQGHAPSQLELDGLPLPLAAAHVWQWFGELHAVRGSSGFGVAPIGYAELQSWLAITRTPARPHELDWLLALDRAFLKACAEASKKD